MNTAITVIPPGSPEAIQMGCTCPVDRNKHPVVINAMNMYWVNDDCPIHGTPAVVNGWKPTAERVNT